MLGGTAGPWDSTVETGPGHCPAAARREVTTSGVFAWWTWHLSCRLTPPAWLLFLSFRGEHRRAWGQRAPPLLGDSCAGWCWSRSRGTTQHPLWLEKRPLPPSAVSLPQCHRCSHPQDPPAFSGQAIWPSWSLQMPPPLPPPSGKPSPQPLRTTRGGASGLPPGHSL